MTRIEVNFTDTEENVYRIEINDPDFEGTKRTVQGRATLSYPKTKTMDILRGSTLKMELEASNDTSYYAFLVETVGDAKLPVILYRNGNIHWRGFVKPDGVLESYVNDYWILNIQAIDGLGYLENTSFIDYDGFPYSGSMKELDILARCLSFTGQEINFRIYNFNIYFSVSEGLAPTILQKPITETFINSDRFKQTDNQASPFNAKEVLESLLKKYGAYLTQQDGVWNIVRLIDYFSKEIAIDYDEYLFNGVLAGSSVGLDRVFTLGSQINNFYPHHANANQQKYYKPSLGGYKVLYKYGFVESVMLNSNLVFNDTDGNIDDWILSYPYGGPDYVDYSPVRGGYAPIFKPQIGSEDKQAIRSVQYQYVSRNDILTISGEAKYKICGYSGPPTNQPHKTRQEIIVSILSIDGNPTYYLNNESTPKWGTDFAKTNLFLIEGENVSEGIASSNVVCQDCPVRGVLSVTFLLPEFYEGSPTNINDWFVRLNSFSIKAKQLNVEGESFTAVRSQDNPDRRKRSVTAVVEKAEDIFVGDNESDIYNGSIEDFQTRNTIYWSKKTVNGTINIKDRFPLLNWLVRDRLQISSGNSLTFSGGVYGYLPYLSVIQIDKIGLPVQNPVKLHRFMTVKYSYDLSRNLISVEYERIFQDNIDNDVSVSGPILEGAKVVKPLIRG